MTTVQKYRVYVLCVLIGSLYILLSEGWERWGGVLQQMTSLSQMSSKVMTPDEVLKRTLALHAELASLRTSVLQKSRGFDQSEAGLVELVGASAKKQQVKIETLTPSKSETGGGLMLSAELLGSFHRIAGFLNTLENSPVQVKIERLELTRDSRKALRAKLSLRATFLRTNGQR